MTARVPPRTSYIDLHTSGSANNKMEDWGEGGIDGWIGGVRLDACKGYCGRDGEARAQAQDSFHQGRRCLGNRGWREQSKVQNDITVQFAIFFETVIHYGDT